MLFQLALLAHVHMSSIESYFEANTDNCENNRDSDTNNSDNKNHNGENTINEGYDNKYVDDDDNHDNNR